MMAARIRNALILYRPLTNQPGVEPRLHDTVLYNSIYRVVARQNRSLVRTPSVSPVVVTVYSMTGTVIGSPSRLRAA